MKSKLFVLAVAALSACGGAATNDAVMFPQGEGSTMIPAPPPGTSFARWEYLCFASSRKEDLNVAGQRGWELVSVAAKIYTNVSGFPESALTYCFKRPLEEGIAPELENAVRDGGGDADEIIREIAREFLDNVATSPRTFVGTARGLPHYVGRESTGVKLYAIEPGSLFDAIGLRTGDIVTAIGDHELDDLDDIVPAWKAAREQAEVRITYVRDGAARIIIVKLF